MLEIPISNPSSGTKKNFFNFNILSLNFKIRIQTNVQAEFKLVKGAASLEFKSRLIEIQFDRGATE
jgi:hypothetical protein